MSEQIVTEFSEASAERRLTRLPLAHLSLELGHLYMEDFKAGPKALRRHFAEVAPWADAARRALSASLPDGVQPRISTCYLIDDYFAPFGTPADVVPELTAAAQNSGLTIDYLARESACAEVGGVAPARLTAERLVAEPTRNANGSRPHPTESGWLTNGERSPSSGPREAMEESAGWKPPHETSARRHSIFVDVQIWEDDPGGVRTWSCPFLASVWQLLRLGLLRADGGPVLEPRPTPDPMPASWDALPGVVRLNARAAPFAAYRTTSVLAPRFLPIELAVRTILSQVSIRPDVLSDLSGRGSKDGIQFLDETVDRIEYVFAGGTARRP
ncbi:SCO2522 family protein [Cryptosporangium sp. NPDC051539]|uniref:SCO2522 family protein n=1 Tax=Cryptosporangium sp. NPDC051539 TaxID=3363962 RepID=UPI0037A164F9